jgi:hypothetical protein
VESLIDGTTVTPSVIGPETTLTFVNHRNFRPLFGGNIRASLDDSYPKLTTSGGSSEESQRDRKENTIELDGAEVESMLRDL